MTTSPDCFLGFESLPTAPSFCQASISWACVSSPLSKADNIFCLGCTLCIFHTAAFFFSHLSAILMTLIIKLSPFLLLLGFLQVRAGIKWGGMSFHCFSVSKARAELPSWLRDFSSWRHSLQCLSGLSSGVLLDALAQAHQFSKGSCYAGEVLMPPGRNSHQHR